METFGRRPSIGSPIEAQAPSWSPQLGTQWPPPGTCDLLQGRTSPLSPIGLMDSPPGPFPIHFHPVDH